MVCNYRLWKNEVLSCFLQTRVVKCQYTYRKKNRYDRGAGFISTIWAKEQDSRPYGKGKTAEELFPGPGKLFWGVAEYAADCHKDVERYL